MLVDSHCHLDRLDLTAYNGDISGAIGSAGRAGVTHMLCVCINLENFPGVLDLAQRFDNVYASVGVHPTDQDCCEPSVAELVHLAQDPRIVAIGETGLDYFHCKGDLTWQHERFRTHIRAAKQCGKPLIIHTREAKEDTLKIMKEEGAHEIGGVMHCFTEDWETARQALDLNFYISFSGIVTFPKATVLHDVAARVPLDRLLIETDSPYLAPIPFRGRTNQPAYVRFVAAQIAKLRNLSVDEVAAATTSNFIKLFKIIK
ncbi:MAG: TatD family hydrolase [Gammaproteobacteria bacterium]|nr:TatD family hydrolase [Gammaproteobacteria bacterium]